MRGDTQSISSLPSLLPSFLTVLLLLGGVRVESGQFWGVCSFHCGFNQCNWNRERIKLGAKVQFAGVKTT